MKNKKTLIICLAFCFLFLLLPITTKATWPAEPLLPKCIETGDCTPNHVLQMFINLSKMILSILGVVALVLFVIGGIIYLTSAGSPQRVEQGTSILKGTIIGIIIVLCSWSVVYFILDVLGADKRGLIARRPGQTECQALHGSEGYRCQDIEKGCGLPSLDYCQQENQCYRGLCPGGERNVCCKPMDTCGLEDSFCYWRPSCLSGEEEFFVMGPYPPGKEHCCCLPSLSSPTEENCCPIWGAHCTCMSESECTGAALCSLGNESCPEGEMCCCPSD